MKIREDLPNGLLGGFFGLDHRQVEEIFETAVVFHFNMSCRIPRIWTQSNLTDAMRNDAYRQINSNTDPYYETLRKSFKVWFDNEKKYTAEFVISFFVS